MEVSFCRCLIIGLLGDVVGTCEGCRIVVAPGIADDIVVISGGGATSGIKATAVVAVYDVVADVGISAGTGESTTVVVLGGMFFAYKKFFVKKAEPNIIVD